MATITVKIKNGKALVTENPTNHKVVIINYDVLKKQMGQHFLYAGDDYKNFPYLDSYKFYTLIEVGEEKCRVQLRDSLLEEKWYVDTKYFVQTFRRIDD